MLILTYVLHLGGTTDPSVAYSLLYELMVEATALWGYAIIGTIQLRKR